MSMLCLFYTIMCCDTCMTSPAPKRFRLNPGLGVWQYCTSISHAKRIKAIGTSLVSKRINSLTFCPQYGIFVHCLAFLSTVWHFCPQFGILSAVWHFVYCLAAFFPTKNMIIELGLVFQNLKLANERNVQGIQKIEIFGKSQGYFGHF